MLYGYSKPPSIEDIVDDLKMDTSGRVPAHLESLIGFNNVQIQHVRRERMKAKEANGTKKSPRTLLLSQACHAVTQHEIGVPYSQEQIVIS